MTVVMDAWKRVNDFVSGALMWLAERVDGAWEWAFEGNRAIFIFGGLITLAAYRANRFAGRKDSLAIEFRHMVGRRRTEERRLRKASLPVSTAALQLPSNQMLREPLGAAHRFWRTWRYRCSGLCIWAASGGMRRFGLHPLEHFSILGYFAKSDGTFDVLGFWVSTGSPREAINEVGDRYRYDAYTPEDVSAGTIPAHLSVDEDCHIELDDDSYLVVAVTPRWHHRLRRLPRPWST